MMTIMKSSLAPFVLLILCAESITPNLPSLHDRIYHSIDTFYPCIRLTNATHQIGCSASSTNTRGIVYHVKDNETLEWAINYSLHPPFICIIEPAMFTSENVLRLKLSPNVAGIIVRYNLSGQLPLSLDSFSPDPTSPNCGYGDDDEECSTWNPYGSGLSRMDFGDFPISAVPDEGFDYLLECFKTYNENATQGSVTEYPLCAVEMVADMYVVKDTATCFERNNLPLFYLNDVRMCEPLGDYNVWGSLFDIPPHSKGIIVIATKLDSTAFFPYLSYGANNDVAGIATLMGIADALGQLKKNNSLSGTGRPIMFVLFHGESWDYIGSSRMVYDMSTGNFPYTVDTSKQQPTMLSIGDISDFLELSHVGMPHSGDFLYQYQYYLHPSKTGKTDLFKALQTYGALNNISFNVSSTASLPPSSFQRFLKANSSLSGVVVSDYDTHFNNKFFGSRFDNLQNLVGADKVTENSTLVKALTNLATVIANSVLNISNPNMTASSKSVVVNSTLLANVLECFLKNTSCALFKMILHPGLADTLKPQPLSRYVTVDSILNPETKLMFQLLAYLTGTVDMNTTCSKCLSRFNSSNQVYNVTWMQGTNYNKTQDNCWCVESYTHYHVARSPAFESKNYTTHEYSTWAESSWSTATLRVYLVTYTLQEVGLLLYGLVITAVTIVLGFVCHRQGWDIFRDPAEQLS